MQCLACKGTVTQEDLDQRHNLSDWQLGRLPNDDPRHRQCFACGRMIPEAEANARVQKAIQGKL